MCAQRNVEGIRAHIPARLCWCGDAEQLGVKLAALGLHRQPARASGPQNIAGFDIWLQLFKNAMLCSLWVHYSELLGIFFICIGEFPILRLALMIEYVRWLLKDFFLLLIYLYL